MTKDEAKIRLRKEGYNVVDDNSVVTVLITPDASLKNTVKDVESKLKALGYDASFSVRQVEDAAAGETMKPSADEEIEEDAVAEAAENAAETEDAVTADTDDAADTDESSSDKKDSGTDEGSGDDGGSVIEYFDDEDSDMLLTEDAVQFSLDDFGLDF